MKIIERSMVPIIVGIIIVLGYPLILEAQAPQSFAYQAIVRDANGNPVSDQQVSLQIKLHQDNPLGTVIYCETHSITTSSLGLVNISIGEGTVALGIFGEIPWGTGLYFLEIEIDPAGGSSYVSMGTIQLISVPYALFSDNVARIQDNPVSPEAPAQDQVLQWDGIQWSPATVSGVSPGWSLTGNSGTDPTLNFLGTTDNQSLRFKVNNRLAGEINPSSGNTFLGKVAGKQNTSGTYNVFIGDSTGTANTEGMNNTFVGAWSGTLNTTGESNTFIGTDAGERNTTGHRNTFIGHGVGFNNSIGFRNTYVGFFAGYTNDLGNNNAYFGRAAGYYNVSGSNNVFLGDAAGYNATGSNNVFLGYRAGYNETGSDKLYIANSNIDPPLIYGDFSTGNVGIGTISPQFILDVGADAQVNGVRVGRGGGNIANNTAFGSQALNANSTGSGNTAIGTDALTSNTTGEYNVATGGGALSSNLSGSYNTANGLLALNSNIDGAGNTASGAGALRLKTTGGSNTAYGAWALYGNIAGTANTALGNGAGSSCLGSGNVFLGYMAGNLETGHNKLYIANSSTNPPLIYGDFSTGKVGIGTVNPHSSAKLEVSSASEGFLPPRMTTAQMSAISSPAEGLVVYNTSMKTLCWYNGTEWLYLNNEKICGVPITYDGQSYNTVDIGGQCWMAQNLNFGTMGSDKDCYGNLQSNCTIYGGLYSWQQVMQYITNYEIHEDKGICPPGWHLPSYSDWATLIKFLGGENVAGGPLKETGTSHWTPPNTGATNTSGFTGLPGGRYFGSSYTEMGTYGYYWSSTQTGWDGFYSVWILKLSYNNDDGDLTEAGSNQKLSVRCLRY